ncbi:inhibitor of growth protein 5 isoform X2 [Fukomys damarensis]|nr:inhibitor of growth protein 5 isoform X2 [Fukomys damarensis]XP_033620647.1 inhibitor of growth protein 5 isoform X2 [Fukomys damarensis]
MLAAEYISTVKTLSSEQRVEHLQKIQSAYSKCKEYSDDKVQLAMQTYEMVDKHIRRLDADLARFEADLKDKMDGSDFESSGGRGLKKGRGQKEKRGSRGRGRRTSEEDTPKKKKHKGGSEFTDTILSVHPSDVLDMPVDPNEPTYCLCHQVSYGEMIGCDNPDCPIEWFHFACVDLTTKPKGKWSVWGCCGVPSAHSHRGGSSWLGRGLVWLSGCSRVPSVTAALVLAPGPGELAGTLPDCPRYNYLHWCPSALKSSHAGPAVGTRSL